MSGFEADSRELMASPRPDAAEAIDLFCLRIAGEVARLATSMGGIDALIFTAGIGEHQHGIRAQKDKSGNYGLTHECKQCKSIKASKKYSSESKEDRERRVSLRKKWLESNRDIVNGLKRKYRLQKKVLKLSSIPHDQHVKEYHSYMFKQSLIRHDNHVREWKADKAGYLKWKYKQ